MNHEDIRKELMEKINSLNEREIYRMHEIINAGVVFTLSEEQAQKAKDFVDECRKDKKYTGTIGGRFVYSFIQTSIGMIYKVKDSMSDKECDMTEYEDW